jgi:FkbM family methyltransferase
MTNSIISLFKSIIFKIIPINLLKQLRKIHYYHKLRGENERSEPDLLMIREFMKEGDLVFDIGANYGLYTKVMSNYVGKSGFVYSFEPIPETFKYLSNNIKKLDLDNVEAFNVAISDQKGKVFMEVPKFENSGENFYEARIVERPDNKLINYEINTISLDDLVKEHQFKPAFIKCDVEGHEWNVIKGAINLLANFGPVLLIEINQPLIEPDINTTQLLALLKSLDYNIYINENQKIVTYQGGNNINYYFLRENHISMLKESQKKI